MLGIRVNPEVARPLNRAVASSIGAASSVIAAVRFAAEAIETWLDEHGEIYEARADVDDPELVEALDDEED